MHAIQRLHSVISAAVQEHPEEFPSPCELSSALWGIAFNCLRTTLGTRGAIQFVDKFVDSLEADEGKGSKEI